MNETPPGAAPPIVLRPWSDGDLALLRRTNSPEMTAFLGGPESEEKLAERHQRYLGIDGDRGRMYVVLVAATGEAAGSIGFWGRTWQDQEVYETGWGVLPEFQGRGIAAAAARAVVAAARQQRGRRWLHAFPKVAHAASNAVCRKAGFTLVGECAFEYPKGTMIRSNDWRTDLEAL